MSKGIQSARRALHPGKLLATGSPGGKKLGKGLQKFDRKLEKKGWFPESSYLQKKEEQKQKKEEIKLKQQQETARVEESASEVERKRFLAKAGGRKSLVASR